MKALYLTDPAGAEAFRSLKAKRGQLFQSDSKFVEDLLREYLDAGAPSISCTRAPKLDPGRAEHAGGGHLTAGAAEVLSRLLARHPDRYVPSPGRPHRGGGLGRGPTCALRDALSHATAGAYQWCITEACARGRARWRVVSSFDATDYPPPARVPRRSRRLRLDEETLGALNYIARHHRTTLSGAVALCLDAYDQRPPTEPDAPAGAPALMVRWLHRRRDAMHILTVPRELATRLEAVVLRRRVRGTDHVDTRPSLNRVEALRECVADWFLARGLFGVYTHAWSLTERGRWAQVGVAFNPPPEAPQP